MENIWKKKKGRPKEGWMDGVRSMGQLGLTDEDVQTATNGEGHSLLYRRPPHYKYGNIVWGPRHDKMSAVSVYKISL